MVDMAGRPAKRRWSRNVTEHSNALDLEAGVFKGLPASRRRALERAKNELRKLYGKPMKGARAPARQRARSHD
jgi:hypothetical protein